MGIETILIVFLVVAVVAVVVFATKSKRKIQEHSNPPEAGRPPSEPGAH